MLGLPTSKAPSATISMHCLDTWKASKCAFPSASAVTCQICSK